MSKTIFRVEKNKGNPYVMMDKRPLQDARLSWRAKGILAYLLSRPDNWTVRLGDIVKRSPDGAYAVRAAIRELRAAGHIHMEIEKEKGKVTQVVYRIYEVAQGPDPHLLDRKRSPLRDFPQAEKPQAENRAPTNTESTNTDSTDIEIAPAESAGVAPAAPAAPLKANQIPEVVLFREVTGRYPNRANFQDVIDAMAKVAMRLDNMISPEDLRPFYAAWTAMGFKPINIAWLTDWAVNGQIPQYHKKGAPIEPPAFTAIRDWAREKGVLAHGD